MTDVAQCACLRVEYKATQHDNGTVTGRWLCAYGGDHEFVQIGQLRAALARAERAEALVREAGVMLGDGFNGDGDEHPRCCDTCNGSPKTDWRYKEYEKRHAERPDLVDLSSWGHRPNCARAALLARIAELEKP